jgi:trigger factor
MQVTETLSDGLKRAFTVVVPAADIESRKTERLTNLGKSLRLPGFRPGKVPLPVIRQRYGTAVAAEVLEESVNEATRQVLSERGLRPAQQPRVDLLSPEPAKATAAQDLEFKVELELLPDITLPDFGAISLTRPTVAVEPTTIETMLGNLASANRDLVEFTEEEQAARGDGTATNGDVLTIDFIGKVDGVEFPGGAGTDAHVDLGGSGFIPGFAEQLAGMKPHETRTIEVSFPADYATRDLAGKAATFDVTAKALRKPVVPPIDDALATKLGFENLDALRQAFVDRTKREYEGLARLRLKRQLLDALAKNVNFPAPQGMVDQEFEQIWQRLEADRKDDRLDDDDKAKDEDTLKAEYRAIAERRVRLGLLLAEIGRLNNLTVTADEMTRAMREQASRYPGQEAQMMEFFRKYPQMAEGLRGPILEEKVVDFVLELARVEDQPMTPEELMVEPPSSELAVTTSAEPAASASSEPAGVEAPGSEAVPMAASGEAMPAEAAPIEAAAEEEVPVEAATEVAASGEPQPGEPQPGEPLPGEPLPGEAAPEDAVSHEAAPPQSGPGEAAAAEAAAGTPSGTAAESVGDAPRQAAPGTSEEAG